MYFFEYIGAFFYWIFLTIVDGARGRRVYSLSDIAKGKEQHEAGDVFDYQCYMIKLKVIGIVMLGVVILISKEL